ncbi:MAG TPA: lytic transglycosylase domain-containing protein [Pyrinomonadaceae bacterium]|nr:lytic transglycosylase domain-containing protein [Pyrinomonadaceae bacterium]
MHFSKAARLLGFVVFGLLLTAPVSAQQTPVGSAPQAAAPQAAAPADAKSVLKSSLSDLSTIYQNDVQRLEKRQQQWKELYNDGLISRLEFENSEKELAAARAKVESNAKEIALANQPAPALIATPDGGFAIPSNLAWTTGNNRVDGLIRQYGTQYGVDPYLIYCLMSQESSFIAGAVSNKGAQGLMQLMPGTAARYGVTNPYDVAQNIKGGTRYLKDLLQMFNGRVDLALAGYNAGEGAVMKFGNKIPPYDETQNYVRLILKRYTRKPAS